MFKSIKNISMKKTVLIILLFGFVTGIYCQTPQYVKTTMISGLNQPIAFCFTPDNRIIMTHKAGEIKIFSDSGVYIKTFYDLSDSTLNVGEGGLLGIECDPDFSSNHYVYVFYVHRCCNPNPVDSQFLRIIRFTELADSGTAPVMIFNQSVSTTIPGYHIGGNFHFRNSEPDKLYISLGELTYFPNAQMLTNPFGKILRLNNDGTIPADNPFYDDGNPATANDDRIWTYGHRNAFDFCASSVNDSLYYSENGTGQSTFGRDEMGMLMKGHNYGWRICEGFHNFNDTTPCSDSSLTPPICEFGLVTSVLPAVTGILHYSSNTFPTLTNHILVADNNFGRISDITLGNAPYYDSLVSNSVWDDFVSGGGLTTLRQGSEGCLYALKGGYTASGELYRICPPGMQADFIYQPEVNLIINPVPATSVLCIRLSGIDNVSVKFLLRNAIGKVVYSVNYNLCIGEFNKTVNVSHLRSGIYTAETIYNKNGYIGFTARQKLIIIK